MGGQGTWREDEVSLHINILELRAIWLALEAFQTLTFQGHILVWTDNIVIKPMSTSRGT